MFAHSAAATCIATDYNLALCVRPGTHTISTRPHAFTHNLLRNAVSPLLLTRSTQRAQTSLAEADPHSHIARCKNVEPWW